MQFPEWLTQNCRFNDLDPDSKMLKTDATELHRKARQLLNAYFSNRKLVLVTLVLLFLVLYLFPSWFGFGRRTASSEASLFCLDDQLRQWMQQQARYDVAVRHVPTRKDFESTFVPFTGNGHIGLALADSIQELRVRHRRSLSLLSGVRPVIRTSLKKKTSSSDAYLTDYIGGSVKHLQCYKIDSECVVITSTVYVHRKYKTVLVQDITVRNPLEQAVEIRFKREPHNWEERSQHTIGDQSLSVISRPIDVPEMKDMKIALSAALPLLPTEPVSVKQKSSQSFRFLTLVDVSEPTQPELYSNQKKLLEEGILKMYKTVSQVDIGTLNSEHKIIWEKLWSTGFSLSYSLAPGVLNGDLINATRYAVLANTIAPLHEEGHASNDIQQWQNSLKLTELCYNSHNTLMYPSKLWSKMSTADELVDVAYRWRVTLEKNGCVRLLEAGADGVALAMVLSFGALKFVHHHLEFATQPKELHRDFEFRNIGLGNSNNSKVNIWVEVGSDNKAVIFASVNHSPVGDKNKIYACDAGCLDQPVQLGVEKVQFPVKLTEPATPILYVAIDRAHLEELKHGIHVKEVGIAPAHEHHVIALHKHGHRLGGLPMIFWVSLAFLILTFHLFLCKLIYNEYCHDEKSSTHGRYSV